MYEIESKNVLTPQNGLNIYRGRTENSMILTETPGADPMDVGVKTDAPELLSNALKKRRGRSMILMGNLGDPYNAYEEEYKLTREALMIIENHDCGVVISTKRTSVLRDIDILRNISRKTKCAVELSFPSSDDDKLKLMEGEETASASERYELIKKLQAEGIEVIVDVYPLIPFINDDYNDVVSHMTKLATSGVKIIDFGELRFAIKKSIRPFFFDEMKKRFPAEYEQFMEINKKDGEILPRERERLTQRLSSICYAWDIMYDTKAIRSWKRKYENKTVGEQLTFTFSD